jgi:hypothetical protein
MHVGSMMTFASRHTPSPCHHKGKKLNTQKRVSGLGRLTAGI